MRLFFNNKRDIIRYAAVKNIRIYDNCLEFLRDRNTLKNFYFMQLFKIYKFYENDMLKINQKRRFL